MKFTKLLKSSFFISVISCSTNLLSGDITCSYGFPKKVALMNVDLKKESASSKEEIVTIEFSHEYLGKKSTSATLVIGEWKYNEKGELLSIPDITVSLKMETKSKKSKIKFVKSKFTDSVLKVIINYGNQCGYWMEVDVMR